MARGTSLWTFGAATAATVAVLAGAFGYVYTSRNRIDLIERLAPEHPIREIVDAAADTQGPEAALSVLADHFLQRAAPARATPPQLWMIDRESYATAAHDFVAGRLPVEGIDFVWERGAPLPWAGDTPRFALFRFQRQVWLMRLVASAPGEVERAVLSRAREFMAEWRRANRVWPNGNAYAWNDDATSNRIETQVLIMQRLRELGLSDRETELDFLRSMLQHADRLMDDEAHNYRSNHGLMQNAALLSLAVNYPEFDRGGLWRKTAVERTLRHLHETVTAQGVFLELAPGYHWYATLKILWFVALCDRAGIELDESVRLKSRAMLRFCREILYPDRTLPMIADTRGEEADVSGWPFDELPGWTELAELRRVMAPGPMPPNDPGASVWPDSGYVLLRAPAPEWTVEDGLMLTLRSGPQSRAHIHQDALSITLFGRGRPLLTGPGYPSYSPKQERRRLIGTTSQNALSVDESSHGPGGTRLTLQDLRHRAGRPELVVVQGESRLFDGVEHRRTIVYGADTRAVLLIDSVSSNEERLFAQHFRVAQGLTSEARADGVHVSAEPGDPETLLRIDGRLVGNDEPRPAVWSGEGPVHELRFTGKNGNLVTLLVLSDRAPQDAIRVEGERITWTGDRGRFSARLPIIGRDGYEWIPREGAVAVRPDVESPVSGDKRPPA